MCECDALAHAGAAKRTGVLVPEERQQFGLKRYLEVDAEGNVHAPNGSRIGRADRLGLHRDHTTYVG